MIATTKLRPTAAPQTEMVSRMMGIGVCDRDSEVEVYITSSMNRRSIIVSIHMSASIRCLCCIDRLRIVVIKAIAVIVLINSIIGA